MQQHYLPAQLDLQDKAIQEQAEQELLAALNDLLDATEEEQAHRLIINHWRRLCAKAEARMSAEQGGGS